MVIKITKNIDSDNIKNVLFEKSLNEINEFPYYLTRYEDIETKVFKNKFLRKRSNGDILRFTHYNEISKDILYKDFQDLSNSISSLKQNIYPVILYSGSSKLPLCSVPIIGHLNYRPLFICSKMIEGNMLMLNLKYKCSAGKKLNTFEVLDLAWLPSYKTDLSMFDIVKQCGLIYRDAVIPKDLIDYARSSVKIWANAYLGFDKNEIKKKS